jgi:hypothetical protein
MNIVIGATLVRTHASNLLIIIHAGRRLSQMKPDAICIFIGRQYLGEALFAASSFLN